jgi:hypothetical protein
MQTMERDKKEGMLQQSKYLFCKIQANAPAKKCRLWGSPEGQADPGLKGKEDSPKAAHFGNGRLPCVIPC